VKERRKCPRCPMNYLYAVRVSQDAAVTFRKCGRVDVDGKRYEPRARVTEDVA
jgi:hypothetical protein